MYDGRVGSRRRHATTALLSAARAGFAIAIATFALGLACGDDAAAPNPLGPDAGDAGSAGAGAEGVAGSAGSGTGGAGSAGSAGNGDTGACQPGETRTCRQDLLCTGEQICQADGSFGDCTCSSVPVTGGSGIVGAACDSDADCGGGAWCMTAIGNDYVGSGGPAHGYCTFNCADTAECEANDPQSRCVRAGPDGSLLCLRTCLSKDPEPGEAKCLNRADLMCNSVVAAGVEVLQVQRQDGLCLPRCGSDADCPARRVCHRQGGVCTNVPPPGAPTGSRCERDNDCDGQMCENRVDGVGTCTAQCVVGALGGCGYERNASVREVACLTPLVTTGGFSEGAGDTGLCRELCDVDADCQRVADGFVCQALGEASAAFFGRSGVCSPR